jgi:polyphosphate kinase
MFPIESKHGRRKVLDALEAMFRDNVKGRYLLPNGDWRMPERPPGTERFEAQLALYEQAERDNAVTPGASLEPIGNLRSR